MGRFLAFWQICVFFSASASSIAARRAHDYDYELRKCEEFYFYDHGTEHCEPCRDICEAATIKGTMDQCWKQCQSYALRLWPRPSPIPNDPPSDGEDDQTPRFPLAAKVSIPVASVAVIVGVLLALVFIRRRNNVLKNRRPPPLDPAIDQTAVFLPEEPNESRSAEEARSVGANFGTEASSSTVAVQEVGRGSQREEREAAPTVVQATPSHLDIQPVRAQQPVPVSPEGNGASFEMALLGRQPVESVPAAIGRRPDSLPELDLDSTELKTLLPSMSQDSLFGDHVEA